MRKEDALALLDSIENSLRRLHIEIRRVKTSNIYKKAVKDSAQKIGTKWFEELDPSLPSLGVSDELRQKYHDLFTTLLRLSLNYRGLKPAGSYVLPLLLDIIRVILTQFISNLKDGAFLLYKQ
jgi:hypothetical protein